VTPTRTTSDTVQKKEESDTKQKQQRHKEEKERMREKYEQLRKEKGDVQVGDKSYPLYDIERAQTIIRHWLLRRKFKRFNAKIVKQYVESSHSLQLRRRNAALKEIVTSERTYVRHLEKIMEVKFSFFSTDARLCHCYRIVRIDHFDCEYFWSTSRCSLSH